MLSAAVAAGGRTVGTLTPGNPAGGTSTLVRCPVAAGRTGRLRAAMTDRKPVRVLLADDQPLLRSGFRMVLGGEPDLDKIGRAHV